MTNMTRYRSLKAQIVSPALSILSIGLMLIGAYSIWYINWMQSHLFQKKVDLTIQFTVAGSSSALWQFDEVMAKDTLAPALHDPDFRAGVIYDERGNVFYSIGDKGAIKAMNDPSSGASSRSLLVSRVSLGRTEEGTSMDIGRLAIAFDTTALARNSFNSLLGMAAIAFFVLVSAYLAIHTLLGRVVRPITLLAGTMDRLSQGSFDVDVPEKDRQDELGNMARAVEVLRNNSLQAIFFHDLSYRDPLTGLPNRRALERQMFKVFAEDRPVAVLMVDIDYFKSYNDTLGHSAGDDCLSEVASAIARVSQFKRAYAARFGGEEFTILLEDASEKNTRELAEAVVLEIRNLKLPHPKVVSNPNYVTVSVGACMAPIACKVRKETVVSMADTALYEAKNSGRNKWIVTNVSPDTSSTKESVSPHN